MYDDYKKKIGIPKENHLIEIDMEWEQRKGMDTDYYLFYEVDPQGYILAKYSLEAATSMYPPCGTSITWEEIKNPDGKINLFQKSYSVSASCVKSQNSVEYRCINNGRQEECFKRGPFLSGNKTVGCFLAIVHALALFKQEGISDAIFSDSSEAIGWIKTKSCNGAKANNEVAKLISRAETWLSENSYENEILKWETKSWGEIPADFGRK